MIRRSNERGESNLGWLQSRFSFSFADYYDSHHMNFGALRVINDDIVAPKSGFGMHPHKNMEIISIVLDGVLTHEDSQGNKETLDSSKIQVMSAGKGLLHSEYNYGDKPVSLLQIWILPNKLDTDPSYISRDVNLNDSFVPIAGGKLGVPIKQDASVYIENLSLGQKVYESRGKGLYLFIIEGKISYQDDVCLRRYAIMSEKDIPIEVLEPTRVLVFEVTI